MSSAPPPNNTTASDLRAVELIPNPAVQRSGLQAYGYLLNKYGFNPTKPGPFSTVSEPSKAASVPTANFLVGSKSKHRKKLQYKGKNGQLGKVPASVVRNDFEWLCPVKVGTPAKTYNLVFDTGSADTWVYMMVIYFLNQQLIIYVALVYATTGHGQYLWTPYIRPIQIPHLRAIQ